MTLYDIKPAFQQLLRPACNRLAQAGVTANQVTIAAMLLSIVSGIALVVLHESRWILLLVPVVLIVRMALNAIDGMLAREHRMQSALGGLLNELGDVISDIALYVPFGLIAGVSSVAVNAAVALRRPHGQERPCVRVRPARNRARLRTRSGRLDQCLPGVRRGADRRHHRESRTRGAGRTGTVELQRTELACCFSSRRFAARPRVAAGR